MSAMSTEPVLSYRVATSAGRAEPSQKTANSASSQNSISSNDFLTLLVTEMKNQDPTQPTDPNAYIQQLVEVNSLQQLISINGELGSGKSSSPRQQDTVVGAV